MVESSTLLYVFVSIMLGMMAFALSAAVNIWRQRNKAHRKQRDPLPLFLVILKFIALTGCSIGLILSVRLMMPYEITSAQGILKGDPIFPILAIDRYEAGLRVGDGLINADMPLVTYQRKLGPVEIAETRMERELLVEQMAYTKSQLALRKPIEDLQNLSHMENLRSFRTHQKQEKSRASWEIKNLKFQMNEQVDRVNHATKEVAFARDAIKYGLVSEIEYDRRQATLKIEQTRLDGMNSEINFAVEDMLKSSPNTDNEGKNRLDQMLQTDLTGVADLHTSDWILNNLESRLRELDNLSDEQQQAVTVVAPWDGFIGYRNPSSMPASGELIGVLVQKDSMFVEVLVPTSLAKEIGEGVEIKVFSDELIELGVTLKGEVRRSIEQNPQQTMLDVRLEHRSNLIRDLALKKQVKLTVSFLNQESQIISNISSFLTNTSSSTVALLFFAMWLCSSLLMITVYRLIQANSGDK